MTDFSSSLQAYGQAASSGISGFFNTQGTSLPTKVCEPALANICMSQYITPEKIAYRIAIPDTASSVAPYDILLSIIAPASVGWAGIAWGGGMVDNPLTVAWSSPNGPIVTSRLAIEHAPGKPDPNVTLTVLSTSSTNATSWRMDVLCTGCSAWTAPDGTKGIVNPFQTAAPIAYAANTARNTVSTPSSNTSAFTIHNTLGAWKHNFKTAQVASFDAMVAQLKAGSGQTPARRNGGSVQGLGRQ